MFGMHMRSFVAEFEGYFPRENMDYSEQGVNLTHSFRAPLGLTATDWFVQPPIIIHKYFGSQRLN